MKKIFALALIPVVGLAILAFTPEPALEAPGGQVTICHFAGHLGDFVTYNSEQTGNPVCVREGGNAITVGQKACEKGHRAATRWLTRTCADRDLQP